MKTQEELARLRDISSQKQSSLNSLLSEKQSLNSSINQYRSLNQTSRQEYNQNLQRLKDVEAEISQYDQSIADAESNIKVLEDKLSKISKFEDFMGNMSSILSKYAAIERKTIDTSTMMVKELPKNEILNSELSKEVCKKKCLEAFQKLLTKLDDVNAADNEGRTLLMHSLSNGFFPAVDILLSNPDIDIDKVDNKGQNALYYACSMPHIDYVEKILNRTKDINIKVPDTGNTALHQVVATTRHRLFGEEYTKYYDLLSDGSDTDYINGWIGTLTISKGNVNIGLGDNPSTYHSINQAKTLLIVDKFLEKGVDLNTQNNNGHTPFTIACGYNLKYITNKWLDNGAVDINFQDNSGKTVLYWMCLSNNSDMVAYLLNKGADHNITEKQGFYPIHGATHNSFVEVINVLLKNGVDINIQSKDGVTLLYYSLGYGRQKINIDLVKFLLDNGVDASIAMNDGDNPIHMAHYAASKEAIEVLIDHGVNLNVQNQELKTPLHCLIASDTLSTESKKEIIKLFRDKYDLSTQDKNGKTPRDYVKEHCPEAIEYLGLDSFIKDSASTSTSVHSSIFDDSQSLIASQATSETLILGDQDSDLSI